MGALTRHKRGQPQAAPRRFALPTGALVLLLLAGRLWGAPSVILAWDPSPSTNVAGYRVYYGPAAGNYTDRLDVGNVTTATVPNLQAGVTYYFVVTAYNAAGVESLPSNEVAYTVPAPPENFCTDGCRVALPYGLQDGETFRWELSGSGSVRGGPAGALDSGHALAGFPSLASGRLVGGRELVLGPTNLDGLDFSRRIYIPTNHGYARFLEVVHNPGSTPRAATVRIDSHFRSETAPAGVVTSSGDALPDREDDWVVTDDADGSGAPALVHVLANPWGALRPTEVSCRPGQLAYQYALTVPPGQTRSVLHFGAGAGQLAAAVATAQALAELQLDALAGITPREQADIVNFGLPDPLRWSPIGALTFTGHEGGPFAPVQTGFSLTNAGRSNLFWTAVCAADWARLQPMTGQLRAGRGTNLLLSLNPAASLLWPGRYTAWVGFTNRVSGVGWARLVELAVRPRPLHRFAWYPVAPTQYAGAPFPVRLQAEDVFGQLVVSFTNRVALQAVVGSMPVPIVPTRTEPFTNGVWAGLVTLLQAGTNLVLEAADGSGHRGGSQPFLVAAAPRLVGRRDPVSGMLQLSWEGSGLTLQAQTNRLGVGQSPAWHDLPIWTGQVRLPVDRAQPAVFFRLQWPPPARPEFVAGPLVGSAPLTVCFTNLSSSATCFQWDFGDGTGSQEFYPTHTYTNAGAYTIRLTATGPAGSRAVTRAASVAVRPTLTCRLLDGAGRVELAWAGTGFVLQALTNPAGADFGARWFDYPGGRTSPVLVPVDQATSAVFYRLRFDAAP